MFVKRIKAYYFLFFFLFHIAIMIILLPLFKKWNSKLRKWTSKAILVSGNVKVRVFGKPSPDANMFILNHQSMLDIMAMEVATPNIDLAWVAKKELFQIPFFGYSLSLTNMIEIDRQDRRGILKLLKDAKDRVSKNRVVTIFPEGTRNTKNSMLKFKSGASIVANKHGFIVQPVVLVNSAKRLNTKEMTASGGCVDVVFLPPFKATKERDWLSESREEMLKIFLERVEQDG